VKTLLLLAVLVSTLHGPVLAKEKLQSSWLDREIIVDAGLDEWEGATVLLEEPVMLVGAFNDEDFLYVSFSIREPRIAQQIMARGLILELDAKGEKPLRIQFPVGRLGGEARPRRQRGPEDMENIRDEFERSQKTFLLLGTGSSDRRRMAVDNPFGIAVRASAGDGPLNYELRVPLSRDENHPYAIGADSGATLALSLETPAMKRPEGMEPGGRLGGGGMRGGGGGGMRGGRGGEIRRGGMRGGGERMRPEPIALRAKLTLAVNPDAADSAR